MKEKLLILFLLIISLSFVISFDFFLKPSVEGSDNAKISSKKSHWFILHRKSGKEFLYFGILGDVNNSGLIKTFQVKPGISGSSPTPLPTLLGREFWLITAKESSADNPDTAPYFLTLNVPVTENWPYGPEPYEECNGQCNWLQPGYFGLHGINGNTSKISPDDLGSFGCVRHKDEDITYLYNLLDPKTEEIRYYIKDI